MFFVIGLPKPFMPASIAPERSVRHSGHPVSSLWIAVFKQRKAISSDTFWGTFARTCIGKGKCRPAWVTHSACLRTSPSGFRQLVIMIKKTVRLVLLHDRKNIRSSFLRVAGTPVKPDFEKRAIIGTDLCQHTLYHFIVILLPVFLHYSFFSIYNKVMNSKK